MARNKYTAEQKETVVARALEIGISAAAKEFGIDHQTVSRWKKAAENVQGKEQTEVKAEEPAEKIEKAAEEKTKKAAGEETEKAAVEKIEEAVVPKMEEAAPIAEEMAAETPVKEKKTAGTREPITAEKIISGAADAKAVIQEKVGDAVAVAQSEIKKAARKAKRAVKDTTKKVKETAEKTAKKVRAANVKMIFETNAGQQITPDAIAERIPKGVDAAYIKLEENKIYWVKGEETGAVDIW